MSEVFNRAQSNTRLFESQSNFERFFGKYDLANHLCEPVNPYNRAKIPIWGKGGVPLSWNTEQGYVSIDHADSHTLIIGPTASKKSRLVMMPLVRILGAAGESMIISDPKAEIYNRTSGYLNDIGYHVQVFNLRDPNYSSSWNPLSVPYHLYCDGDIDRAYEFINDIAVNLTAIGRSQHDPFWDDSAGMLFSGLTALLFKYCKEHNQPESTVHIGNILHLRNILCSGNTLTIANRSLWKYAKSDLHIASMLIGTLETANDTRAGILSVFDQKMRIFTTSPNLLSMLSTNEIFYDDLANRPTALFLLVPDEKTTYHGLISLFIKQSYEYLIYRAHKSNTNKDAKLHIRLNYVLDEFSSLPTIADFPAMITASRSRNIRFNIAIQSKHQLVLKYSEDTDTILSNCNNWIFLTSRETKLLEELSSLCGQNYTVNPQRPIMSNADLQRLDKDRGESLILSGRFKPFLTRLPDISLYDKDHPRPPFPMQERLNVPITNLNIHIQNEKKTLPAEKVTAEIARGTDSLLSISQDAPESFFQIADSDISKLREYPAELDKGNVDAEKSENEKEDEKTQNLPNVFPEKKETCDNEKDEYLAKLNDIYKQLFEND